MTGHLTSS